MPAAWPLAPRLRALDSRRCRHAPPSARSPRPRCRRGGDPFEAARCRACSPAARSRRPATRDARHRRARARGGGIRRVRLAPLPRRGRAASCASSAAARTAVRGLARPTGGVDSLTERELELARLVVDRKTNPEIAAALFLSQKTVETHLRNIFRKLGVASRVELARAVERADYP